MGIQIGDLIDRNIKGREALNHLARHRRAEAVRDKVEVDIRFGRDRVDKVQIDERTEQRITGSGRPTKGQFIGLQRPVEQKYYLALHPSIEDD